MMTGAGFPLRRTWTLLSCCAGLFLTAPSLASAVALGVSSPGGLGLDVGYGCLSSAGTCSTAQAFSLVGAADATGTITIATLGEGVFTTATIDVDVALSQFTGTASGVDEVEFQSTNYSSTVSVIVATDVGDATKWAIAQVGFPSTSTVAGDYEQLSGGGNVAGPTPFSLPVDVGGLSCLLDKTTLVGQCGFHYGASRDFTLGVGSPTPTDHDFVHEFNVLVPEPGTLALLGLGLCGFAALRRTVS